MNLIKDPWIPVIRQNGQQETIAPYQITENINNNPILSVYAVRPDFNGALVQFLIGLLQTAFPDLKKGLRRQYAKVPPDTGILYERFKSFESSFNLWGDAPLFMQDLEELQGKSSPISGLLIEQPGENTLKENADLFVKRGQIKKLCPSCTATALFTLQINAPSGGAGHRTSMRGGGPLTTIVSGVDGEAQSLWKMLWLNILPANEFDNDDMHSPEEALAEGLTPFPWCMPTKISKKDSEQVRPSEVHPFQQYWNMPRRIRLSVTNIQGECDLCEQQDQHFFYNYVTQNYGNNYSEHWRHILTPYYQRKAGETPLPMHPQPGGITYKHWLPIALDKCRAKVIDVNTKLSPDDKQQIWVFGYDMDNMKARCWYEASMPSYALPEGSAIETLKTEVDYLIKTAGLARSYLAKAIKQLELNTDVPNQQFWKKTEKSFYERLEQLIDIYTNTASEEQLEQCKQKWLEKLRNETKTIFDQHTHVNHTQLRNMQQWVTIKKELNLKLYGSSLF